MTIRTFALATMASIVLTGAAAADERINVTPTLYRELARATAAVRPASELTTTPSLTPQTPTARRVVADASAR